MSKLRVIYAEIQPLLVEGLRFILMNSALAKDVHPVQNSDMLNNALLAFEPDILVIDYSIENAFSLSDIMHTLENFPKVKILVISNDLDRSKILSVLEAGIHGYITKSESTEEICNAIRKIMLDGKYFCSFIIDVLVNKQNFQTLILKEEDVLTKREKDIVKHIANGNTNKQIGELLSISHHTVHTHRKNVMKKLGVNSSTELTLYAVNNDLLKLP